MTGTWTMLGFSRLIFATVIILAATAASRAQTPAGVQLPLTPPQLVDKSVRDLQRGSIGAAVKDDIKALRRGPLLIHGNYCGIGNRPGTVPIDALDTACMHHDACTTTGGVPSCKCDAQLRVAALAISRDPQTPPDLQVLAASTAASMVVLICK